MGPEILIAGERAHRGELVPRVQDLGYTVVPVRARELVRRAAQNPGPAAVIVCLGGPEAGELVQGLRQSPETAALPVLLYGRLHGETRDLAAVLELGADRFLEAPVDEAELKAALAELAGPPEVEPRPEARTDPSLPPRPTRADPVLSRLHDTLAVLAARLEAREESADGQRDGIDLEAMGLDAVPDVDPEHDSGELELLREPTQRLPPRSPSRGTLPAKASAPPAGARQTRGELTFPCGEEISPERPSRASLEAHDEPTALVVTSAREDVRKDRTRSTTGSELSHETWLKGPGAGARERSVALARGEAAGDELVQETGAEVGGGEEVEAGSRQSRRGEARGRLGADDATAQLPANPWSRPGGRAIDARPWPRAATSSEAELRAGDEAETGRRTVGGESREATVELPRSAGGEVRASGLLRRGELAGLPSTGEERGPRAGREDAAMPRGSKGEVAPAPRGGRLHVGDEHPRGDGTEVLSRGTDAERRGRGIELEREDGAELSEGAGDEARPRAGRFRVGDEQARRAGREGTEVLSRGTGEKRRFELGRKEGFEPSEGAGDEAGPRAGRFRVGGEQPRGALAGREGLEELPRGPGAERRGRRFELGSVEAGELSEGAGDEARSKAGRFRVGDEHPRGSLFGREGTEDLSQGAGAERRDRRFDRGREEAAPGPRAGRFRLDDEHPRKEATEELSRGTGDEVGPRAGRFRLDDEHPRSEGAVELSRGTASRRGRFGLDGEGPRGGREPMMELSAGTGGERRGRLGAQREELPEATGDGRSRLADEHPRGELAGRDASGEMSRGAGGNAQEPRLRRLRRDSAHLGREATEEQSRGAGAEVASRAGHLRRDSEHPHREAVEEQSRGAGAEVASRAGRLRRDSEHPGREATDELSRGTGASRAGRLRSDSERPRHEVLTDLSAETGAPSAGAEPPAEQLRREPLAGRPSPRSGRFESGSARARGATEELSPGTGVELRAGHRGEPRRERAGGRSEAQPGEGEATTPSGHPLPSGAGGELSPLGAAAGRGEAAAPALLAELRRERFTGCLQVVSPGAPERRLWWSEGQVIGGASAAASESVLGRLQARGLLSAAQVELAARWGSGDPRRDVERLARSGMIKPQEMREALREPVRRIVERIAEAGVIAWALHPGLQPVIAVELGVPLAALIAGGVQRGSTLAELRAAVGDERRPRLAFAGPEALAAELRWPAVAAIAERFDGQTTVAELIAAAVADEQAIRAAIFVLELLGHLASEIDDPEASLVALDRQRVRERLRLARESDYFALLGLPREASRADVLRAHADLTATFCEGLEPASRVELAEELEELLAALDEARDVLADDALHSAYLAQIGAT